VTLARQRELLAAAATFSSTSDACDVFDQQGNVVLV
jgi:hypothetical protein